MSHAGAARNRRLEVAAAGLRGGGDALLAALLSPLLLDLTDNYELIGAAEAIPVGDRRRRVPVMTFVPLSFPLSSLQGCRLSSRRPSGGLLLAALRLGCGQERGPDSGQRRHRGSGDSVRSRGRPARHGL